jgi:hypothetical protein
MVYMVISHVGIRQITVWVTVTQRQTMWADGFTPPPPQRFVSATVVHTVVRIGFSSLAETNVQLIHAFVD